MSVFLNEYTLNIEKSVDKSRELFEKSFLNMAEKGYSGSTVIHHSSYGIKKFSGTVDEGVYKARLILSHETDSFYRSAPINKITFSGNEAETQVRVSVGTGKYGIAFFCILAVSVVLLASSVFFIGDLAMLIPFISGALITALISFVPLFVAKHRVNEAKETLIYILKYADNG